MNTSPALSTATPPGDSRKSMPVTGSTVCPEAGFDDADDGRLPRYPVTPRPVTSSSAAAPALTHFLRFRAAPARAEPGSDPACPTGDDATSCGKLPPPASGIRRGTGRETGRTMV